MAGESEVKEGSLMEGGPGDPIEGTETETPSSKEDEGHVEAPPEDGTPAPEEPEPPKFKHKTWEETEKARVEAERKMTEAAQEAAELRKRFEEMEKKPSEPVKDPVKEKRSEIRKNVLEKIKALPADAPDREDQIADFWLDAQSELSEFVANNRETRKKSESDLETLVDNKLEAAGFKSKVEKELFKTYVIPKLPSYLKNSSFDDQWKWAIKELSEVVESFRDRFVAGSKKDRQRKDDLSVLGVGGRAPVREEPAEEKGLISLGQQLKDFRKTQKYGKGG